MAFLYKHGTKIQNIMCMKAGKEGEYILTKKTPSCILYGVDYLSESMHDESSWESILANFSDQERKARMQIIFSATLRGMVRLLKFQGTFVQQTCRTREGMQITLRLDRRRLHVFQSNRVLKPERMVGRSSHCRTLCQLGTWTMKPMECKSLRLEQVSGPCRVWGMRDKFLSPSPCYLN